MRVASFLKLHKELPPGVNPHPTLKGKKRFEMLQAFNLVLAFYILIHQLIVPLTVYFLRTAAQPRILGVGFWYLYHFAIALMLWGRSRAPRTAYSLVYLAWFGMGYLPLTLAATFFDQGVLLIQWKAVSGTLCYGSSFVLTVFLLYRMRMPTFAFLFRLESRIVPKWRYAIPYVALGLTCCLFWLFCPIGKKISPPVYQTTVPTPTNDAVKRRYQYE